MRMNQVDVNDSVSSDLGQRSEGVLQVIGLNPEFSASKIGERYDLSDESVLDSIDVLMEKGLVRQLPEDVLGDLVWEVTELGRLRLLRWAAVMDYEVREAEIRGQPEQDVDRLRSKRKGFEKAYLQCKEVFE